MGFGEMTAGDGMYGTGDWQIPVLQGTSGLG